ncbi:hypothetical protein [Actinomyces ruminis]|uniref:hypothetical protein n=1 Tax=Actinomyces ruminis TaxID=1937003 RepID=UPI0011778B25|nr:hypothetical protein [Actinomyces ruminis]
MNAGETFSSLIDDTDGFPTRYLLGDAGVLGVLPCAAPSQPSPDWWTMKTSAAPGRGRSRRLKCRRAP